MIKLWGGEENAKAQVDSNFHNSHSCSYGFGYDFAARWFDTRSRRTTSKGSDRVDGGSHLRRSRIPSPVVSVFMLCNLVIRKQSMEELDRQVHNDVDRTEAYVGPLCEALHKWGTRMDT